MTSAESPARMRRRIKERCCTARAYQPAVAVSKCNGKVQWRGGFRHGESRTTIRFAKALLLLRLSRRVALAVAIRRPLRAVVHGRQRGVRLGEAGEVAHQLLQLQPGLLGLPLPHGDTSPLIHRACGGW